MRQRERAFEHALIELPRAQVIVGPAARQYIISIMKMIATILLMHLDHIVVMPARQTRRFDLLHAFALEVMMVGHSTSTATAHSPGVPTDLIIDRQVSLDFIAIGSQAIAYLLLMVPLVMSRVVYGGLMMDAIYYHVVTEVSHSTAALLEYHLIVHALEVGQVLVLAGS